MSTAVTRGSRDLRNIRKRQGVVTPFSPAVIGSVVRPAANGDAGARPATQDDSNAAGVLPLRFTS
jgi:hypothetical protein